MGLTDSERSYMVQLRMEKAFRFLDEAKKMGNNGRQFVMDNLTKEVGTQKYVDVIKEVVKE